MITYQIGKFAKSKAGHDKEKIYIIIKEDKEYVYLVDGKNKLLTNPKRKNKRHVQVINTLEKSIHEKIKCGQSVDDVEIVAAINKIEQN